MGKIIFRYRGQIPALILILAIPFLLCTKDILINQTRLNFEYYSIILIFLGCFIRFYTIGFSYIETSGRNRNNHIAKKLNTTSMYSVSRNPLYFGNVLIWIGIILRTNNLFFLLLCVVIIFVMYYFIIKSEETFLKNKFEYQYLVWKRKTPAFVPNFLLYKKSKNKFNYKSILRREYSCVLAIFLTILYLDIIELFLLKQITMINKFLLISTIFIIFISITLKYLRKNTTILDD